MWEISAPKTSKKHCSSKHYSLNILIIASLFTENIETIHPSTICRQACVCIFVYNSTNILEYTIKFQNCMINEHVFLNLVSLNKKFNPH